MTATWRFLENYQVEKIDNTWREYEFMFHEGGPTTLINICPQDAAILIDDIQVYQVKRTSAHRLVTNTASTPARHSISAGTQWTEPTATCLTFTP